MKYLNSPIIFSLNQALTSICTTSDSVTAKAELFQIGQEDLAEPQISSYERPVFQGTSPGSFGANPVYSLEMIASSKHFPILKTAFENSFPDYDFSSVMPWHFKLLSSMDQAHANITWAFTTYFSGGSQVNAQLWQAIDSEVGATTCDIYAYEPDCPDAFSEMGSKYQLTYFFIHPKMTRILLFQIREGPDQDQNSDNDNFEEQYGYGFF